MARNAMFGVVALVVLQASSCSDDAVRLSASSSDDIARLLGRNVGSQISLSDDVTRTLRDRLRLNQNQLAQVADNATFSFVDDVTERLRRLNASTDNAARDYLVNVACKWYDDGVLTDQDLYAAGLDLVGTPSEALRRSAIELSNNLATANSNGDAATMVAVAATCYVAG